MYRIMAAGYGTNCVSSSKKLPLQKWIWVHPVCETRRQTPALGKDVTCTRNLKKKKKKIQA